MWYRAIMFLNELVLRLNTVNRPNFLCPEKIFFFQSETSNETFSNLFELFTFRQGLYLKSNVFKTLPLIYILSLSWKTQESITLFKIVRYNIFTKIIMPSFF